MPKIELADAIEPLRYQLVVDYVDENSTVLWVMWTALDKASAEALRDFLNDFITEQENIENA